VKSPPGNPKCVGNFYDREIGTATPASDFWNGAFDPDLPAAVGPVALNVESIGDTSSYNAVAGYVVFHFGNGKAGGSPGGWWQAWYLDGLGGTFTVLTVGGASVGAFLRLAILTRTPVSPMEAPR
jgi:hypothetical protein